ncbi:putative Transcriptional Regulator, AraC family protein [Vibrio nigripulchritudo MADA3029]|uniref:Transcriptional Regulator, AraC family protein n=2 Tax=Vibrio nigripulchritudo TaxID=28173 RepID=A0AAV2VUV1_9VIBR|nr:AraC family transcriptional regulator [Vibrio nigripulchritudo]EGU60177.1 AraC family DNA-binding domain-containing protein [Vibrio nigripulchritudo ATCC 27043]CCN34464.1 putative Transcriptional Regulator, AraC family protein [Vibrio nigripulchritudo AM115]CCN43280.1 putative Transcriptional Regulator, AraC family protein [Vibrio nigripulchritudo FTn2]CCN49637.1 putative Transcriptional Regulator, AraC family protein [Vibrio nigripulchritudo MADA3020]CCN52005.1 putative Transcriptional Reg
MSTYEIKPYHRESLGEEPVWEFMAFDKESVAYTEHGVPHHRIKWHVHEQYELHLIVKTTGKAMIGNHVGPFSPGQLILVGPWLPHNWVSYLAEGETHKLRDMVVLFEPELIQRAAQIFPELSLFKRLIEQAKMGVEFLDVPMETSMEFMKSVRNTRGVEKLTNFLRFMDFLNEQKTRILSTLPPSEKKDSEVMHNKINLVLDYVMLNHEKTIRVKDVADLIDMTESYFSRFFHKSTGHRFTDFVNRIRIQRACIKLVESKESIANISQQVGFANLANFSRQFRRIKGLTPLAYRKKNSVDG